MMHRQMSVVSRLIQRHVFLGTALVTEWVSFSYNWKTRQHCSSARLRAAPSALRLSDSPEWRVAIKWQRMDGRIWREKGNGWSDLHVLTNLLDTFHWSFSKWADLRPAGFLLYDAEGTPVQKLSQQELQFCLQGPAGCVIFVCRIQIINRL